MVEAAKVGPSKLLLETLALIDGDSRISNPALAVDLGCGTGKDTAELLRRKWQVLAIDFCKEGIEGVLLRPEATQFKDKLEARVATFDETSWSGATLVAALLSLPYCPPDKFAWNWASVVSSLVPGGYFVGNFFGHDHLQGTSHIVRCSRNDVETMLAGLEVIRLEEDHRDTRDGDGSQYHYFDVIARKAA